MRLRFLWIALLAAWPIAASGEGHERRLTVTGLGLVEVVPDMATVRLGVASEARGAREAIDENSRAMAAILERLRAAEIEERDIQTSNFSVSPRYDYNRQSGETPRITGFIAQNMVAVRVRDLDRLGTILDEVARDGANSFNGLSFGLQERAPAEDAARAAAVAEARRKAELYAGAAGVTLGAVMTLSESGGAAPQPMMMAVQSMRAASDAVPVAAGELTVSARVTIVYAIE